MNFTKKSIAYLTNAQLEFIDNNPTLLNKFNSHYTRMVEEGKAAAVPIITRADDGIFLERHFTDQAALDEHLQFCNIEFTPQVPDAQFPNGGDL
jgi:hypothetical protein